LGGLNQRNFWQGLGPSFPGIKGFGPFLVSQKLNFGQLGLTNIPGASKKGGYFPIPNFWVKEKNLAFIGRFGPTILKPNNLG